MKKALREHADYSFHSPLNKPQFTVKSGEEFIAETEFREEEWSDGVEGKLPPGTYRNNPCVCVAVEDARPGDILAVEILDIIPAKTGRTGFSSSNKLANYIKVRDWGIINRQLRIEDGYVLWSDRLKIPVRPMLGCLGTAPRVESLANSKGGVHGGNMDVQEVCKGNTVYLPVEVEGALLHLGDAHAIQGDGEINVSGGIECRAEVRLRVFVKKRPEGYRCVRIENNEYIMTVACERSLEESFYLAAEQLINWMTSGYGFSVEEAYLLLGQVLEARCTQFVNPTRSYICKIAKKYLGPPNDRP